MKTFLISVALKILKYYSVKYLLLPENHSLFEQHVKEMVEQVQSKFKDQSGEFKRHQVLRAVMNIHPEAKEKDIAYQIEIAVRERG